MSGMLLTLLLLSAVGAGTNQDIRLEVRANRTAIWAGDRLEYRVLVEYPNEIEFVLDNLRKEEMSLEPFEVLSLRSQVRGLAGGKRLLELVLELTSFETGVEELEVPSFNLYYFRRGEGSGDGESEAQTLTVPPMKIGLRSTLLAGSRAIRELELEAGLVRSGWQWPGLVGVLGLVGVAALASRRLLVKLSRTDWRQRRARRRARESFLRQSLERINRMGLESREQVEEFYRRASELVRALVAERLGDGAGLVPEEVERALISVGEEAERAREVRRVLEECDAIRYRPDGFEQGRRQREEFLRRIEELAKRGI